MSVYAGDRTLGAGVSYGSATGVLASSSTYSAGSPLARAAAGSPNDTLEDAGADHLGSRVIVGYRHR